MVVQPTESVFRGALQFFDRLGIYDVVLPFLMVFALVFALLEKTKVLGEDTIGGKKYTRKSLNAIIAFVAAFMVIASSQLVALINQALSQIVILLMISVFFLLLVGSFHKDDDFALSEKWKAFFTVIMFIGIVLIFLQAVKLDDGTSWLEYAYGLLAFQWDTTAIGSIILIVIVLGLMLWMVFPKSDGTPVSEAKKEEKHSSDH